MRIILPVSALAILATLAPGLPGQPIAVNNPGFESPVAANGFVVLGAPAGWSIYNPQNINGSSDSVGVINPSGTTHFPAGAAEGRNAAVIFMDGPALGEAGLFQTLNTTLQPGLRYTLEVDIGNIDNGTANFGFFNLKGFPGYRVDLLAGTSVIASDNDSLGSTIPEGEFRSTTLSLDIGAIHPNLGQSLGIRLVNLNQSGTATEPGIEVNFDNVRLTATVVPEPRAVCLAGIAGMLWVLARRRR